MRIQEFDPKKKYVVSIPNPDLTSADAEMIKANLRKTGMDAVVVCGAELEPDRKYFGLYCEQCGCWWTQPDNSNLVFYPAPEIANAHLQDTGWFRRGPVHLWKVQEFGKEERVSPENLKPGAPLCPVLINVNQRRILG